MDETRARRGMQRFYTIILKLIVTLRYQYALNHYNTTLKFDTMSEEYKIFLEATRVRKALRDERKSAYNKTDWMILQQFVLANRKHRRQVLDNLVDAI